MDIIILSGMSGSGKSVAVQSLEDIAYFCIDNLPPQLLAGIILKLSRVKRNGAPWLSRLAVVVDSRSADFFPDLYQGLNALDKAGLDYRVVFLDASNETLISRYNQSRRNHPLAEGGGINAGINKERALLKPLRERADRIINTDGLSERELRKRIQDLASERPDEGRRPDIIVQSFGFKYGVPEDSDLVIDVRFLPNPYYIDELRPLSGKDPAIRGYLHGFPETERFLTKQTDLLLFLMPYYIREGKMSLTISVGCTGGRHRSVCLAEDLALRLKQNDYKATPVHRDIAKDLET